MAGSVAFPLVRGLGFLLVPGLGLGGILGLWGRVRGCWFGFLDRRWVPLGRRLRICGVPGLCGSWLGGVSGRVSIFSGPLGRRGSMVGHRSFRPVLHRSRRGRGCREGLGWRRCGDGRMWLRRGHWTKRLGGGRSTWGCPCTKAGTGRVELGIGAGACTTGGSAAARWAWAGTEVLTACPEAVTPAGATMVTFVTLLTMVVLLLVMLVVVLPEFMLLVMRMPTLTTGGAPVTTEGAVPTGAGMMMPARDPGGGGTKTPGGPQGLGPAMTPGPPISTWIWMPGAGGTKTTPGAPQWPVMNTTMPSRCS